MHADSPTPLLTGRSILARCLTWAGQTYSMHVAEINDDGAVTIRPFESEQPSTLYTAEPVEIVARLTAGGWRLMAYAAPRQAACDTLR